MNISHNAGPVVTPLKALWRWLMAEPGHGKGSQGHVEHAVTLNTICTSTLRSHTSRAQPCASQPSMRAPLRVLRVMEAGQAPAQVGRMRISGRMADVCAELDRLAACESLLH